MLAIVAVFQIWKVYTKGATEITVFTDHKNLTIFYTTKELNWRQIYWLKLLSLYQFRIKYRLGKKNGRIDILSRYFNIINREKNRLYSILWKNKDDLLSLNISILALIVIIKREMEQSLKRVYQKNRIFKILLKKKSEIIILEIKERLYILRLL